MESKTLFRILKKHLGDNAALLLSDNNFELYGDCGAKRKENEKKNELQEIVEAFDWQGYEENWFAERRGYKFVFSCK